MSPSPSPTPTALPYAHQIADQFVPIYFVMAVLLVGLVFLAVYVILIQPWFRSHD